ncbi:Cro/Cl family transcriptional regulator [Acidithiobacillus concretivorus]|uniref:Cro/Cl family transcriptional regulator n=1 Tax=Acidithiobacillus concretivorus TaxID=3063952 RepID=A0ABS5ZRC5_9PROT|nr:Cro/Cl family transcriptional regulator [Acidithiobacillus concretivorus]MBU2738539.1 hypothetical protein [Acidithiobacillus concretivorus]
MKKSTAIRMFGTGTKLGMAINLSKQAISNWPEVLNTRRSDEIIGAALRLGVSIHEIGIAIAEPTEPYTHGKRINEQRGKDQIQSMSC